MKSEGRKWHTVSQDRDSVTKAIEIVADPSSRGNESAPTYGCLIRVETFASDDSLTCAMVFVPGLTLDRLKQEPKY